MHRDHSNSEQPRQKLAERLPCPVHGGVGLNVSVRTNERGQLRAKCWSHGCDPREILHTLGELPAFQHAVTPNSPLSEAERKTRARETWARAEPANDTLAELYLRVRGITIPTPASLRYNPRARHPTGVIVPAMVAAIVRDREITGIQRTFLVLDEAGKAAIQPSKITQGVAHGGCVRLAPAGETIALAEGVETALSVQQATKLPTWATLGAGNLAHVLLPDIVREVIIAADNDASGGGLRAAYKAADTFIAQGRKVRIALPQNPGEDFNDLLLEGGPF